MQTEYQKCCQGIDGAHTIEYTRRIATQLAHARTKRADFSALLCVFVYIYLHLFSRRGCGNVFVHYHFDLVGLVGASIAIDLYKSLDGYMYTNIGLDEATYLAANFLQGVSEMKNHSLPGEVVKGEEYAEYHVDMNALYELILEVFYTKVG